MEHRRSSIACTTAAVPPTAGQLVTSERGVCEGPLAFHCNFMSHTAFRQSLACVRILHQTHHTRVEKHSADCGNFRNILGGPAKEAQVKPASCQ
jgi:hypothetical protein